MEHGYDSVSSDDSDGAGLEYAFANQSDDESVVMQVPETVAADESIVVQRMDKFLRPGNNDRVRDGVDTCWGRVPPDAFFPSFCKEENSW